VLQCNSDYITCCIRHSNYEQCIHTIRVVAFELDCSCTVLLQGVVLECSNSVQHSTLKVNCSGTCKTLDLMIDSGRRAWVRQISTHCVIVCVPILCCRPHLLDSRVSGLCALCCHSPLCYETSPRLLYSNDVCWFAICVVDVSCCPIADSSFHNYYLLLGTRYQKTEASDCNSQHSGDGTQYQQ
jgi:hypothetical protein